MRLEDYPGIYRITADEEASVGGIFVTKDPVVVVTVRIMVGIQIKIPLPVINVLD